MTRTDAPFRDRFHAGQLLALELAHYADRPDVLVLAIPREGVPIAFEVARALGAPLDVFVVHDIVMASVSAPIGVVGSGGVVVLAPRRGEPLPDDLVAAAVADGIRELAERERAYRGDRSEHMIASRTIVLVDDHLSHASRLAAAAAAVRRHGPRWVVAAAPAACAITIEELRTSVDDVISLSPNTSDFAAEHWFDDCQPMADSHVRELLELADELLLVA